MWCAGVGVCIFRGRRGVCCSRRRFARNGASPMKTSESVTTLLLHRKAGWRWQLVLLSAKPTPRPQADTASTEVFGVSRQTLLVRVLFFACESLQILGAANNRKIPGGVLALFAVFGNMTMFDKIPRYQSNFHGAVMSIFHGNTPNLQELCLILRPWRPTRKFHRSNCYLFTEKITLPIPSVKASTQELGRFQKSHCQSFRGSLGNLNAKDLAKLKLS